MFDHLAAFSPWSSSGACVFVKTIKPAAKQSLPDADAHNASTPLQVLTPTTPPKVVFE